MKNPRSSAGKTREAEPDIGTVAAPAADPVAVEHRRDEPIVAITNSGKGGAGKTALGHAVVHTALALGRKPVIFDFDAANPDLWAGWTEVEAGDRYALRTTSFSGWESVMRTIRSLDGSHVVVLDLPANTGTLTDDFLLPMMEVGGYFATLWALDPGRKPLDALVKYCAGSTAEPVVVAKSIFKVENGDDDFEVWKRFGSSVDLRGGFVFNVPTLESSVRVATVEGGEDVMTVEDLGSDRGGWSIDRIAADERRPLRARRARAWLAKLRPEVQRAMALARRIAP